MHRGSWWTSVNACGQLLHNEVFTFYDQHWRGSPWSRMAFGLWLSLCYGWPFFFSCSHFSNSAVINKPQAASFIKISKTVWNKKQNKTVILTKKWMPKQYEWQSTVSLCREFPMSAHLGGKFIRHTRTHTQITPYGHVDKSIRTCWQHAIVIGEKFLTLWFGLIRQYLLLPLSHLGSTSNERVLTFLNI